MRDLRDFFFSTVKSLFASVIGWTLNIITFAALWVSVTFQSIPVWAWIVVAILNIFIAMFLAWRKEKVRAEELIAELRELKDSRPTFTVSVGDIKRYTIQPLIEASKDEITSLEQVIEKAKKPAEAPPSSSLFRAGGALGSMFAELRRMQENMPSVISSLGYETNEEKLERLKRYHMELLQHEDKLKDLYKVRLSVESTRHDKNVEIEVTSNDTTLMIVEDDYETDGVPTTTPPDHGLVRALGDYRPHMASLPGKYYLRSYAEDNMAFSELAYINASRPTDIFNSAYYIESKQDKVNLQIKIHSTKLTHAHKLTILIGLQGVPAINIRSNGQ